MGVESLDIVMTVQATSDEVESAHRFLMGAGMQRVSGAENQFEFLSAEHIVELQILRSADAYRFSLRAAVCCPDSVCQRLVDFAQVISGSVRNGRWFVFNDQIDFEVCGSNAVDPLVSIMRRRRSALGAIFGLTEIAPAAMHPGSDCLRYVEGLSIASE